MHDNRMTGIIDREEKHSQVQQTHTEIEIQHTETFIETDRHRENRTDTHTDNNKHNRR